MNTRIIRQLVLKDLYIHRWPLFGLAVALPAAGLGLALAGGSWGHIGLILMCNSLIYLGLFLPMGTVVSEKKPFVMSLPISPIEYALSKLLFGGLVFLLPWLTYLVALPRLLVRHEALAAGSLPPSVVLLGAFLLSFAGTAAVALAFESMLATTIAGLLICIVVFAFLPLVSKVPTRILEHWVSDTVVWDKEILAVLCIEGVLVAASVVLAVVAQKKKKAYI